MDDPISPTENPNNRPRGPGVSPTVAPPYLPNFWNCIEVSLVYHFDTWRASISLEEMKALVPMYKSRNIPSSSLEPSAVLVVGIMGLINHIENVVNSAPRRGIKPGDQVLTLSDVLGACDVADLTLNRGNLWTSFLRIYVEKALGRWFSEKLIGREGFEGGPHVYA